MTESSVGSNGNGSTDGSAPTPGLEGHRLPGLMDWYDTLPEKAQRVVANVILERGALISALTDQRRNLDQDCGYPEGYVQPQTYQQLYDRESIAARVVEVYPLESWQVQPTVYEDEDPATETEFEKVWDALGKSLSAATGYYKAEMGSVVWEYLSRADVLSGVGQYGVILLGLDDGKDLSEPAEFVGPPPPWMQDSAPDATPQDDRPGGPGPTGGPDVPPPGVLPAGTADIGTGMGRPSGGSPLGFPVRNVLGEGYTQALSILERGFQTNYGAGESVSNAFCATGPGGGIDPSCSLGGSKPVSGAAAFERRREPGANPALPDQARPELGATEAKALRAYAGGAYQILNQTLRDGKTPTGHDADTDAGLRAAFAQTRPFSEPVGVSRGVSLEGAALTDFIDRAGAAAREGTALTMPAYTSTTTHPPTPDGRPYFGGNVGLEISARFGLDAKPHSSSHMENELLLARGSRFKVLGVEKTSWGHRVRLEQLNDRPEVPAASTPAPASAPVRKGFLSRIAGLVRHAEGTDDPEGDAAKFVETDPAAFVFDENLSATRGSRQAGRQDHRSTPARGAVRNAAPRKPARRLLFLRVFPETMATIASYDVNPTSPRFGQPTEYVLTFLTPTAQGGGGMATLTTPVHWTRCIHVADNLGSSEVFGTPRQQQVLNRLLDLRKLYGGSAEMYWRGAFPGYSIETLPQLGTNVEIDEKGLRDQMYRWANGLQRYVQFTGMSMKGLSPQVVDPTGQINTQLEAICIKIGVPKRIFMGSERGELASSQDEDDWNDKLGQRQNLYVTPRIIVPFVDRLIALGVLPPPAEGYLVEWPGLSGKSETQQATIGGQRTTALVAYAHEPAAPALMAPMDFFTRIMGFSEDEAQTIVDNAEEEKKRIQAEEDAKAKEQAKVQADALAKAEAQQAKQATQGPSRSDGGVPPGPGGPGPSGGTDQPPGDGPGPGGKPPQGGKLLSDPAANARGDQPRVPPGSPEGGEFTSVAGSGGYVAGDKVKVLRSKITRHEGLEGLVLKVQANGSLLVKLKNGYRDLFRPHEVQPTGKKGNVEPDPGTNPLVGSDKPVGGGSPTEFTLAQLREASLRAGKQLFDHPEKNERLYYTDVHSIRYRHLDDLRAAGEGLGDFEYIFKPSTGKGVLMQAAASDRWDKINPKQAADKDGKIYSYTAEGIVFVTETAPKKGRGGQSGPPAANAFDIAVWDRLGHEGGVDTRNAFCPTGPGGGIDPTCSPGGGGSVVHTGSATGDLRANFPTDQRSARRVLYAQPATDEPGRDWRNEPGHPVHDHFHVLAALPQGGHLLLPKDGTDEKAGLKALRRKEGPGLYVQRPVGREGYSAELFQAVKAPETTYHTRDYGVVRAKPLNEHFSVGATETGYELLPTEKLRRQHERHLRAAGKKGPAGNVFCATGEGGGIDPSCSSGGGGPGAQGGGHDLAAHGARALEGERLGRQYDETNAHLDRFAEHEGTLHEVERAHEEDPHLSALWDRVHGSDNSPFGPDITPPKDVAAGRKYLQEDHTLASAAVAAAKGHLAKARGAATGLEQEAAARLHAAADAAGARLDRRLGVVAKHHARSLDDYNRWASLPAGHPQQEQAWSNFDHSSKQVGRALDHLNSEAGLHGFFDRASSLFDRRRRVLEGDAVRAERELQRWDHQAGGVHNTATLKEGESPAANYNPDQPRHPAGTAGGGRFAPASGAGGVAGPAPTVRPQATRLKRAGATREERAEIGRLGRERTRLGARIKEGTATTAEVRRRKEVVDEIAARKKAVKERVAMEASGSKTTDTSGNVTVERGGSKKTDTSGNVTAEGGTKDRGTGHVDHASEAVVLHGHVQRLETRGRGLASGGLVHLADLRAEMAHLSKDDFDKTLQESRRQGLVTLTGAEGRHGLTYADREAAVHEEDPLTGRKDRLLLYASSRGAGTSTAGAAEKANTTTAGPAGPGGFLRNRDFLSSDTVKSHDQANKRGAEALDASARANTTTTHRLAALAHREAHRAHTEAGLDIKNDLSNLSGPAEVKGSNSEAVRTHRALAAHHQAEAEGHEAKANSMAQANPGRQATPLTIKEVQDHMGDSAFDSVKIPKIMQLMETHHGESGLVQEHGMPKLEEMEHLEMGGIKFHYPRSDQGREAAAGTIANVASGAHMIPAPLWKATSDVIHSSNRSGSDPYWARQYNDPAFRSNATGGDGKTVVYGMEPGSPRPGPYSIGVDSFAHEAGHNFAKNPLGWAGLAPPAGSAYHAAQQKEPPVTEYARNSPVEDFAEAASMYTTRHDSMRVKFPLKYRAFHDLMEAHGGGVAAPRA